MEPVVVQEVLDPKNNLFANFAVDNSPKATISSSMNEHIRMNVHIVAISVEKLSEDRIILETIGTNKLVNKIHKTDIRSLYFVFYPDFSLCVIE